MSGRLSLRIKLGFGVCDIGGNLFFTVMAFQLAYYLTDVVGLGAVYMGIVLMLGRVVDAVTDPLMGYISDRTKSRWGRRRPYLFFGALPLFVFMALMFHNPGIESQVGLFVWAAVTFSLLSTAYTIVNIPYGALTPELTKDFNERTVLNGYRMSFAVIGTLLGAGAALPIVDAFNNESAGYTGMGIIFGAIMMITALITFFTVKEPDHPNEIDRKERHLIKEYLTAFKNKPFLLILFPWALFITGVTVASSILKYYFEYVLENPEGVTLALVFLLLFALAGIPVWVQISKKIGKKRSYMAGMSIFTAAIMALAYAVNKDSGITIYIIMAIAGVGLSTHYIIPYSLIPDVVEWDYVHTGERREGIYYGLWTFISKLGQAFSGFIIGLILSGAGYVPGMSQAGSSLSAIRLLTGPIPLIFILTGIIIINFYPITRKVYQEIIEKED